jgi:hypothetical protein
MSGQEWRIKVSHTIPSDLGNNQDELLPLDSINAPLSTSHLVDFAKEGRFPAEFKNGQWYATQRAVDSYFKKRSTDVIVTGKHKNQPGVKVPPLRDY